MILDGLPLELIREVLLDLPTVDVIQTVKCTRRLYHFAKFDKALGRRLQNRVFDLTLFLDSYDHCRVCEDPVLQLFLQTDFRPESDAVNHWNLNYNAFFFRLKGGCKCRNDDDQMQEISSKFVINNDSLDEAIINCGKLFNIFMKFCVIRSLGLTFFDSADHLWGKMNAFFNANPPDVRIQPCVSINSEINLDNFLTGLAEIEISKGFGPFLTANPYHEVLRRTPSVSFEEIDLPYTYKDLVGFFKDTKKLSLHSATRITKKQIRRLVQHFYEVQHDEECMFEIEINEEVRIKDLLTLIPKKAYKLHPKKRRGMDPVPEMLIWAEMTDKFGGRWAMIDMALYYGWVASSNLFRICSMNALHEDQPSDLIF
ncbi:hypothetical protein WR25_24509 [Diploscapter pachys]|uniref:F-box domain-containing protein n=1 Tax=Diploscapter pachys TaxID=2018661 RepID=A0A2A2L7V1_9BILA|nr:hypothetical protein WR25_24509 [Diploscapter pachys]